jgi:sec-independent protein translocase protein TatA
MLSPLEIGACMAVIVLLFGVKRLPELGSGVGEAISNFRKSYRDGMAIDVTPEQKKIENETQKSESNKTAEEVVKKEETAIS